MDFSLKRWRAHFCPPPILPAKKACFLPPFQVFGHVAHMFFRFLLHRFCVFLHDFCIFPRFFCQIFCLSKRKLADLGSNLLCFWWSSHANFAEFSDLYGWNYPARPSVWLKLSSTPFCTVEIIQHALLYGWNYPARPLYGWNYPVHPSVWLRLPNTPSSMVEITQHALKGQKLLAQGNALGIRQSAMRPVRAKALNTPNKNWKSSARCKAFALTGR